MTLRRRARGAIELVLVLLAYAVVPLLPRRAIVALARGAGRAAYGITRSLRRIAEANLDLAFGEAKSPAEKRRLAIASFQGAALVLLDLLWFSRFSAQRVRKFVRLDESVQPCFERVPLIAVTAHIGNWEVFGQALSLHGAPLASVVAPIKNSAADWVVNRARRRTGQSVIRKQGAGRALLRELKRGGRTAILIDQNTLPLLGGEFVPFFGLDVPVSKAASLLSLRSDASVIVGWCVPDGHGYYTGYCLPPFRPAEEGMDEHDVTARLTAMLQEVIAQCPEYWMWSYKRWKYIPEGSDGRSYPFYVEDKRVKLRQSTGREADSE